jgi:hypothetical protein
MLLRVAGRSPLHTVFPEDRTVFLPEALARPWHLFAAYAGYLELLPRLIGQLAASVPLLDAAPVFALSGAVVAAAAGLLVYHASAGHIRSTALRALLGAAVVLLPLAPLEIADSGVDTSWYLMLALFWAALWRPATRGGLAAAAAAGFLTAASNPLALAFAPLFALRVAALRRVREHAATAGWAAGLLLQLPVMAAAHRSRLGDIGGLGQTLAFYAHDVLLPALGWRFAWALQAVLGRNGATLAVGLGLAAVGCLIAVTGSTRVRLFAAAAVVTGFLETAMAVTLSGWVPPEKVWFGFEPGSRYTALPVFLLQATAIVAVDGALRRRARAADAPGPTAAGPAAAGWRFRPPVRPRAWPASAAPPAIAAGVALVAVLSAGWATDFRNSYGRGQAGWWAPVAARWLTACERSASGQITVHAAELRSIALPCASLHGVARGYRAGEDGSSASAAASEATSGAAGR